MENETPGAVFQEESTAENQPAGDLYRNGIVQDLAMSLYKYQIWILICAILLIIGGIMLCLTIFGVIIAWLPIWIGSILLGVRKHLRVAAYHGELNELSLSLGKLNKYFKVMGILNLILIILLCGIMLIN